MGEIWGRCGEICGDVGRYGEVTLLLEGRSRTLAVARALCRVACALLLQHRLPARHLGEQPVLGVLAARLPPLQLGERAVELAF